jgi:hypothetical protein
LGLAFASTSALLLEAATNLLRLFRRQSEPTSQGLRAEISCGVRLQVLRGVSRSVPAGGRPRRLRTLQLYEIAETFVTWVRRL